MAEKVFVFAVRSFGGASLFAVLLVVVVLVLDVVVTGGSLTCVVKLNRLLPLPLPLPPNVC